MIICFAVIILLQSKQLRLFYPICFEKIQRLLLQAPVPLHCVSWEPQVVSVLTWASKKQWTGQVLNGFLLLTIVILFKAYAFTLTFIFSHFWVVCREGAWHNKPFHHYFCALGCDLFSGFLWIFSLLSFLHIQFLLSKSVVRCGESLFALLIVGSIVKFYSILSWQ